MSALYHLKSYGECKDLELDDLDVSGATVIEQEPAWRLEVLFRADSEDRALDLAEEIMSEAQWEYGDWHEWHIEPIKDER